MSFYQTSLGVVLIVAFRLPGILILVVSLFLGYIVLSRFLVSIAVMILIFAVVFFVFFPYVLIVIVVLKKFLKFKYV